MSAYELRECVRVFEDPAAMAEKKNCRKRNQDGLLEFDFSQTDNQAIKFNIQPHQYFVNRTRDVLNEKHKGDLYNSMKMNSVLRLSGLSTTEPITTPQKSKIDNTPKDSVHNIQINSCSYNIEPIAQVFYQHVADRSNDSDSEMLCDDDDKNQN